MSRPRLTLIAFAAVLTSVWLLAGCPLIVAPTTGSLTISMADHVSRTLLPAISMDPATYSVSGSGPNGTTFSQTTSSGSLTVTALAFGTWSVTVSALNAGGTLIGQGSGSAVVQTATTTTLAITVTPLAGNGTLTLSVSWPASQVGNPTLQASLIPSVGSPSPLAFSISGNQGSFSSSTIPAGYQTLTLQVLDNGVAVAGAVEVVRIVAGQITTGSYNFTNVNSPTGTLVVNITSAMANPIPVSISGVPSTVTTGTSITATASATDGTSNPVYVWYLNGVSKSTGPSYTFGSALAAGYFRLDVTAYTPDGTRAGSTTAKFQATTTTAGLGPAPVSLGTAGNFVILAKTAISNLSPSLITGNVGISPAPESFITGLPLFDAGSYATSLQVTGFVYAANMAPPTPAILTTAVVDMQTAYSDAAGRTAPDFTNIGGGFLGGLTLVPGLYKWNLPVTISSDVTLTGGPNDVWIFQVQGSLTEGSAVHVILSGGAQAKNIFWQVAGQVSVGTASVFQGNILSQASITLGSNATMNGRALSQLSVSLVQAAVTMP